METQERGAPRPQEALSLRLGGRLLGWGPASLAWIGRPTLLLRPGFRAGCQGRPDKRGSRWSSPLQGLPGVTATRASPARLGLCPPHRRGHGRQEEPRLCTLHPPTPRPLPPSPPAQARALGGAGREGRARRGTRLAQARAPSRPQSPAPGRQCRGPGGTRTSVFPPRGPLAPQTPSSCYTFPRPHVDGHAHVCTEDEHAVQVNSLLRQVSPQAPLLTQVPLTSLSQVFKK